MQCPQGDFWERVGSHPLPLLLAGVAKSFEDLMLPSFQQEFSLCNSRAIPWVLILCFAEALTHASEGVG